MLSYDCFADEDMIHFIQHLMYKSPLVKDRASHSNFEKESVVSLTRLFLSRLIVFKELRDNALRNGSCFSEFDWLCYQKSTRTRSLFANIFDTLGFCSGSFIEKLMNHTYGALFGSMVLIFDECQQLLLKLQTDYHSSSNASINLQGEFIAPRSLFSFIVSQVKHQRTIWCGTHMRIKNIELFASAAAGKTNKEVLILFSNFFIFIFV